MSLLKNLLTNSHQGHRYFCWIPTNTYTVTFRWALSSRCSFLLCSLTCNQEENQPIQRSLKNLLKKGFSFRYLSNIDKNWCYFSVSFVLCFLDSCFALCSPSKVNSEVDINSTGERNYIKRINLATLPQPAAMLKAVPLMHGVPLGLVCQFNYRLLSCWRNVNHVLSTMM